MAKLNHTTSATNSDCEASSPSVSPDAGDSAGAAARGGTSMNMHSTVSVRSEASVIPLTWNAALEDYRNKRAISDATPIDDEEKSDAAVDAYCEALDRLVEDVPAPSIAAVLTKLDLVTERYEDSLIPNAHVTAIMADLRRLGEKADTLDWGTALARYRKIADAEKAERESGDFRRANDEHNAVCAEIVAEFGVIDAKGNEQFKRSVETVLAAERRHEERFLEEQESALNAVLAAPAPDLGAICEKLSIAISEFITDEDFLPKVLDDLTRLRSRSQSVILTLNERYEQAWVEYGHVERGLMSIGEPQPGSAEMTRKLNLFDAQQQIHREVDALRVAILYQVPATWQEALVLALHAHAMLDLLRSCESESDEPEWKALEVGQATLLDFLLGEVDHESIAGSQMRHMEEIVRNARQTREAQ